MAQDEYDYKISILMKEWDQCRSDIARFDTMLFSIRSWSVSIFTAILGASVALKSPPVVLLAILPTVLFWFLDSLNKSFQRVFINRTRVIEQYLNSQAFKDDLKNRNLVGIMTPETSNAFYRPNKTFFGFAGAMLREAKLRNVMMTYISLLIICFVSYFILKNALPSIGTMG